MIIETINGALHQWDTGRQVQVTCDEGMALQEVRFSHHRSPSPIIVAPDAGNVANIPDELLRHSGMLWVSAVVTDARGKEYVHSACLCTEAAVRPKDYNSGGSGGTEMVEKVVFDSTKVELEFNEGNGYNSAALPEPISLEVGKTYTVYLGGNPCERTAFEITLGDMPFVMLGNAGLDPMHGQEDTGEPFAVGISPIFGALAISSGMPTDIKITTMEEKAVGGGMFVVHLDRDDSGKAFCDKTLEEIVTAFNNGMLPVMVDPEFVYNLMYNPSAEEGAVFTASEVVPGVSKVYAYYVKIYPSGYIRTAGLILSGELDWDDGEPGKPT